MFKEKLNKAAAMYGISLHNDIVDSLENFYRYLVKWNKVINLIGPASEEEIIVKHFIDSFTCFSVNQFLEGNKVIDIGTGAGFPGVPLGIVKPDISVVLMDSTKKKTDFLSRYIDKYRTNNLNVLRGRAEDKGQDKSYREKYDIATSRAVAYCYTLFEYCLPFVAVGGIFLAMKGPNVYDELKAASFCLDILGGKVEEVRNISLPYNMGERNIVVVRKIKKTPLKYPRRTGVPKSNPLK